MARLVSAYRSGSPAARSGEDKAITECQQQMFVVDRSARAFLRLASGHPEVHHLADCPQMSSVSLICLTGDLNVVGSLPQRTYIHAQTPSVASRQLHSDRLSNTYLFQRRRVGVIMPPLSFLSFFDSNADISFQNFWHHQAVARRQQCLGAA